MIKKCHNKKGFTLAESLMASVILSITAAGILVPFTTGATMQAEGNHRTLAARLAADLIEEIINESFDQIIAAYNYTESQGYVKDASGSVFSNFNYAKFSRTVTCSYVYVPQETGATETKFILATVRVSYDDKELMVLNRLIGQ